MQVQKHVAVDREEDPSSRGIIAYNGLSTLFSHLIYIITWDHLVLMILFQFHLDHNIWSNSLKWKRRPFKRVFVSNNCPPARFHCDSGNTFGCAAWLWRCHLQCLPLLHTNCPQCFGIIGWQPVPNGQTNRHGCSAETEGAQSTSSRMKRIHRRVKISRGSEYKEKHISRHCYCDIF